MKKKSLNNFVGNSDKNYIFNLIIRVLLCFIPLGWFNFILAPITVYLIYFLLIPFGGKLSGDSIILGINTFNFIDACIAVAMYYLLWILVLLTKEIKVFDRVKILLFGFFLLLVMNVFRVFILVLIADNYGILVFDAIHLIWWKFMSGIYVAFVWIFLVKYFKIDSIPIWDDIKELIGHARK